MRGAPGQPGVPSRRGPAARQARARCTVERRRSVGAARRVTISVFGRVLAECVGRETPAAAERRTPGGNQGWVRNRRGPDARAALVRLRLVDQEPLGGGSAGHDQEAVHATVERLLSRLEPSRVRRSEIGSRAGVEPVLVGLAAAVKMLGSGATDTSTLCIRCRSRTTCRPGFRRSRFRRSRS